MFTWILGLLLGSCLLVIQPSTLPAPLAITILGVSFLTIASVVLSRKKHYKHSLLTTYVALLSGILFGFAWASIHASWRLSQQIQSPDNKSVHIIEAELESLPAIYPEYCQFNAKVTESKEPKLIGKKLLLKDYSSSCKYALGDLWQMTVKLKPIYAPVNQAGFDYEFYMFQRGFAGRGYVKNSMQLKPAEAFSINSVRQDIHHQLSKYNHAGLFQALIIGEKSSIPPPDKDLLQTLGLSHLIAISGLHISIIAGFSFWLFFKVLGWTNQAVRQANFEPLRPAVMLSCAIALLYTALADFSLPTVRALIMWCSVAFSLMLQRQSALFSGLQYSLFIIVVMDPLSVLSASFWMTFAAVVVIGLVLAGKVGSKTGAVSSLQKIGRLQFAISIALIIPSVFFFQQATLLGLLVNIIVIPIFSVIVLPLIMIGAVLDIMADTSFLLELVDRGVDFVLQAGRYIAEPLSNLSFELYLPSWLLLMLMILIILLWLPLGRVKHAFFLLAITSLFLYSAQLHYKQDNPKLIVFDVGHGLAVLLTDGKHHILYDTGYAAANGSAFNSYIAPTLDKLNIGHLDLLVLSHRDNDHSGGVKTILNHMPVKSVLVGSWSKEDALNSSIDTCRAGISRKVGAFALNVLHPVTASDGKNNDSCVVKVTSTFQELDFSILLTGDIEKEAEFQLAETMDASLEADIMLVPHHGSDSSSRYPFIKMVAPDVAIYSVERYSRYNLPNNQVIKRYQDFGIQQLHTGCHGQITYDLRTKTYRFERENLKIWRKAKCEVIGN
ncbi:DNA internalization-related competence protein ComEC/Rec2 [Kangiella sp. HD9-110m-PIT-SAG07]|nr:DNA internalization-related competence protein ComEC/Rec2 [Kangiella sp. HD9-110m-PIT-SAG07]